MNEQPVIGYDAKRAFCNRTGLGNYSRGVIAATARSGLTTVLYTPRSRGAFQHYFDSCPGVAVRTPRGFWRLLPSLWRSLGWAQRSGRDGVRIYHGLSHELPLGLPCGMRSVVTMHDLIVWRYPQWFSPIDVAIHRRKQRHACRVADLVVAISEQTKRDLVEIMGVPEKKIRVVYQTCENIFWEWDVKKAQQRVAEIKAKYGLPERYVICVGTIEERKNQLCAIRAMDNLPADVGLVIVGRPRGDYGKLVTREAGERVRILSDAAFDDFPALYAGAVASVYLSRFEGFGIPVLESMCCDTPVVTSNLSSMPEAGGDAALYAAPDDVDAVAEHLLRLCTDEAFRSQCVEKGRVQRELFAPSKVAADMLAVYRSLIF